MKDYHIYFYFFMFFFILHSIFVVCFANTCIFYVNRMTTPDMFFFFFCFVIFF